MNAKPQKADLRYAILFRTHYWNEFLSTSYDRLQTMISGDTYVAFDCTNAAPPASIRTITHSVSMFENMGLFVGSESVLWHRGDYPFYGFAMQHPEYDYYIMVENDVHLSNVDFDTMVVQAKGDQIDLIGAHIQKLDETKIDIHLATDARNFYTDIYKVFFPVVVLSRSAVFELYTERLRQHSRLKAEGLRNIPFCEVFVATELTRRGRQMNPLSKYFDLSKYGSRPFYLIDEFDGQAPNQISHPVLPLQQFIASCTKYELDGQKRKAFRAESAFWERLRMAYKFYPDRREDIMYEVKKVASAYPFYSAVVSNLNDYSVIK